MRQNVEMGWNLNLRLPRLSKSNKPKQTDMKTKAENFKGIEFIRISALPEDQKTQIWQSFQPEKIIKIVKDQALMNDCILYQDYLSWLEQHAGRTHSAEHYQIPAGTISSTFPSRSSK